MSMLGCHDVLQFKRVKFTEKVSVHLNFFPLGPWVSIQSQNTHGWAQVNPFHLGWPFLCPKQ